MEIDDIESLRCNETKKLEENTKQLFQICMEGRWDEVVEIYNKDKRTHTERITRSGGDSALHLAVTDGQEDVVSQLVELIVRENKEALRIQNKRKNTALHLAASMGTNNMVRVIAHADPSLVSVRNVDGETPLFLAAFHGRKEAFMILHFVSLQLGTPINYSNCRRNDDGDTILHSTIASDNFELAFQIIQLYGDLVNWVNERGATPLHLLATKPSAFKKSGSRLGRIETFIYHGIHVKKLKAETNYQLQPSKTKDNDRHKYPKNYQACMHLMTLVRKTASVVTVGQLRRTVGQLRRGRYDYEAPEITPAIEGVTNSLGSETEVSLHPLFPKNYLCCAHFLKFVYLVILVIFGGGTSTLRETRQKKEKHCWSFQIMNELLKRSSMYENEYHGKFMDQVIQGIDQDQRIGGNITEVGQSSTSTHQENEWEAPIITAAKNGVIEVVEMILEMFPMAIHDLDAEGKNIVLLAIENRHIQLYQFLVKRNMVKESLLGKVDYEANSALHLAAKLGVPHYNNESRLDPVAALQMQWEIKWFKFIQKSVPPHFFRRYNASNQTPQEIFTKSHRELVIRSSEWLKRTSESCSLVAALIATVAFATSTTIPGGVKDGDGKEAGMPNFVDRTAYKIFSIASLIALAGSVNSVVLFLSILASRFHQYDFEKILPRKLMLGLISMLLSIVSMLVSFCAAHFLGTSSKLRNTAVPIYAVACLPLTYFALSHFPLYLRLLWSTTHEEPHVRYDYAPL